MVVHNAVAAGITIDGRELERRLRPYVEQVVVDDHLHLPDAFAITLFDPERDVLERAGLRIGARVEISGTALGEQEESPLIHGEVTALEAAYDALGARIVVRGYDLSHRLQRGRRTRTFLNVSDSDIAKKIADEAQIEIGTIEPSAETYEHVSQANLSDWDFLTARARRIGYEVVVSGGKLSFRRPEESSAAPAEGNLHSTDPRQLVFGRDRGLLEYHPRITAAGQVGQVEVRGWDRERKEAVVANVRAFTLSAAIKGTSPARLARLFGNPTFVADEGEIDTQNEAEAAADAIAEQIGSAFAEAEGVARGDPALKAGTAVSVAGVADGFGGTFVLSHTRHIFDRDGYRTHFEISGRHERSLLGLVGNGGAPTASANGAAHRMDGLVTALVTANDDPDKLGRVKLRYPWLDPAYESDWARVARFEAGADSGAIFIPQVDDEVLVGFEFGDINHPVVLGGLHNGVDKPRIGDLFDNGKVKRRGFISRSGHVLAFWDDEAGGDSGITLSTGDGKVRVVLDQSGRNLTIYGDPKVVIEAERDLEVSSKGDLTMTARGSLTIKARGKLAIQSDSVVDVDGKPIQLN